MDYKENASIVEAEILDIKANQNLPIKWHGVKSSSLSDARNLSKWIPNGFSISKKLVTEISLGLVNETDLTLIKKMFLQLSKNNPIIVRSSSTLEWYDDNSFAGLYSSIRGVENFKDLIRAIKSIHQKSKEKSLVEYSILKGIALPEEHLGVLVQSEVAVKYSSLAIIKKESDYIEFFQTDIIDSVQGLSKPSYTIDRFGSRIKKKSFSNKNSLIPKRVEMGMLKILDKAKKQLNNSEIIHLEIGSNGSNEFIFQINRLQNDELGIYLPNRFSEKDTEQIHKKYPLKAEAMRDFKELNLFSNPLKIYRDLNLETLLKSISKDFNITNGVTVRFSYGDDISLPRGFFKDSQKLKNWLTDNYTNTNISIIVHSYLEVRRSFELLLNKTECLLEHIPGMWESDNELNPDVLFVNQTISKAWKWKHERNSLKGVFDVDMSFYQNPIDDNTIVLWQQKLFDIIEKLRSKYYHLLPLNFHFVEDDKGDWNFLNIRKGFSLQTPELSHSETHIIKEAKDVFNWNEKQPLQLQLKVNRGSENEIINIIKLLPKVQNQTVIVDFGLLSHPAIILREFGYKLIPSYLYNTNRKASNNYQVKSFDIGSDPVDRIMKEEAIFENQEIKIVQDRNQIVNGHLLLITKEPYTSLIEVKDFSSILLNVIKELRKSNNIKEYIILERGRAKFCTSGFTDSHAHAHIFPRESLKGNYELDFIKRIDATKMNSLKETIEVSRNTDNEYVMLINDKNEVFLKIMPENTSVEKQLIRNFFKSYNIE